MYDKFGEFDSVEELNEAARGFLAEGDLKSLREFAEENGLDKEDVEDYIAGEMPELATSISAAMGKFAIEEKEIEKKSKQKKYPLMVILEMAQSIMSDREVLKGIMRKGKRIEEIYKRMESVARKHKQGSVGVACGTDRELQEIIRAYYTKGEKEAKEVMEKLYE